MGDAVAVRNFFRETTADQSIYDELLVVRPPKRIVGGLTLKLGSQTAGSALRRIRSIEIE